jgi:hypothetical protein
VSEPRKRTEVERLAARILSPRTKPGEMPVLLARLEAAEQAERDEQERSTDGGS